MFKKYILLAGISCSTLLAHAQQGWTSKFVQVNKKGALTYTPDAQGNTIPDFSKVGYYQNSKPLPAVPVVKAIEPTGDNSQQVIQNAIDELAAKPVGRNGFRGAILLKKGVYKIPGTITITVGGIVLRGEGDETKLVATGKGQRTLIDVKGKGRPEEITGRQSITNNYVPVGATSFTIASTKGLKAGDSIMLYRPGTQQWINDLQMNRIETRDSNTLQWTPAEYNLYFERIITRIKGNTIFIDNPVVMAMEDKYGGGAVYRYRFAGRINNVGIENLLCESEYTTDTDEDHGWDAIKMNRIENGWVRNVTAVYFGYSCVNLGGQSRNITVLNCKCLSPKSKIEGGRRYSFNNDGQLNLFMDCFASNGRHDYVTGARVAGPNVFYNCRAEKTHADIGPHHRWAMGTLYDNVVSDGAINAQDRGNWGTGHGWSGVNQVFWNCIASKAAIQDPWVSGRNYVIGMQAQKDAGRLPGRNAAEWEGQNKAGLTPASLYQAQLQASHPKRKSTNYLVRSQEEFNSISPQIKPGDNIFIANGTYTPWTLVVNTNGTEQRPVTIRAETTGKVIFTGDVLQPLFKLTGSYTILQGINFTGCNTIKTDKQNGILVEMNATRFCRLTACVFTSNAAKAQFMPIVTISGQGQYNRVDHCTFSSNIDNMEVQVRVSKESTPLYTLIDNNTFSDKQKVSWKVFNGGECVQIGQDPILLGTIEARTTVRDNRFIRCNGEPEVISNKSSANLYINNYFEDCDGELVMRGGHDCIVDSNTIKGGNSGIRVNGTGHTITHNRVSRVKTGIRLMYGMSSGKTETGFYVAAGNCMVAYNHLEDVETGILVGDSKNTDWTGKFDTKRYPSRVMQDVAPVNNHISNNIFIHAQTNITEQ